ncbi:hypothetical protein GLOIN_2v1885941 [Rhizophagus irregularis DAOM 181602=DAOM 197198]|nr:hypothetical protein GLOIN_2v1885941 [Rhizophagus irregularis DAOM 181602=DAOM 197198]
MESGNKLRESSRKKIEELLIEGNHKRSDRSKAEAETTAVKPTSTPTKPLMTKLAFFKLRDGFLQIQKLSVKESFIADVVKNVSKLLIKVSIYPTKDECYGAVEGYLILNHASFFSNFTEDDWIAYYNENIHKQVSPYSITKCLIK